MNNAVLMIGCVVMLAGLVTGIVGGLWTRREQKRNPPSDPDETQPAPVLSRPATVADKEGGFQMTGTYQMPGHRPVFLVHFRLGTGELLKLEVPEALFDGFAPGQSGTLVTQNGNFLDFSGDWAQPSSA